MAFTAEHKVDDALVAEACTTFRDRGIVDLIVLAGCYDLISSLLKAFQVPTPK